VSDTPKFTLVAPWASAVVVQPRALLSTHRTFNRAQSEETPLLPSVNVYSPKALPTESLSASYTLKHKQLADDGFSEPEAVCGAVLRSRSRGRGDEMKEVALYALLQLLLASGASGQRMRRPLQEEVAEAVKDGMVFWVASHGGVGSNSFARYFESLGARVGTSHWRSSLCHAPQPVAVNIPTKLRLAVYLYGSPLEAMCSMKKRGLGLQNIKKLTHAASERALLYSDAALVEAIHWQFKNWTALSASAAIAAYGFPVLRVRYADAHTPSCISRIASFLQVVDQGTHRPARQRSNHEACVSELLATLSHEHLGLVREMDEFVGDCGGRPSPPLAVVLAVTLLLLMVVYAFALRLWDMGRDRDRKRE